MEITAHFCMFFQAILCFGSDTLLKWVLLCFAHQAMAMESVDLMTP